MRSGSSTALLAVWPLKSRQASEVTGPIVAVAMGSEQLVERPAGRVAGYCAAEIADGVHAARDDAGVFAANVDA